MLKETLSDRIDILEEIETKKELKRIKKLNDIDKKVYKKILNQFNKAKEVLGHRLSMEEVHSNMFKFYFDIGGSVYLHFYICKSETIINPDWKLIEYNHSLGYEDRKLYKSFKNKYEYIEIQTEDLSNILIEFVNIYFKEKKDG